MPYVHRPMLHICSPSHRPLSTNQLVRLIIVAATCFPAQVSIFNGKAAVPLGGIFGFQKAFFLHPETDELYGRVQLQKGPLGNALYPLYYRASVEPSIIAGTTILPFAGRNATIAPADMCAKDIHVHAYITTQVSS